MFFLSVIVHTSNDKKVSSYNSLGESQTYHKLQFDSNNLVCCYQHFNGLFYLLSLIVFGSHNGVFIIEFDATIIQVGGLAKDNTRFNPPCSSQGNACTYPGI